MFGTLKRIVQTVTLIFGKSSPAGYLALDSSSLALDGLSLALDASSLAVNDLFLAVGSLFSLAHDGFAFGFSFVAWRTVYGRKGGGAARAA